MIFVYQCKKGALLTKKKAFYPEYWKARDEMQDIAKTQKNVELFFRRKRATKEKHKPVKQKIVAGLTQKVRVLRFLLTQRDAIDSFQNLFRIRPQQRTIAPLHKINRAVPNIYFDHHRLLLRVDCKIPSQ